MRCVLNSFDLINKVIKINGYPWCIEEYELNGFTMYNQPKMLLRLTGVNPNDCYVETGLELIKKIIFNGPATIVFWKDGTKTVVKCAEGENYDKRVAIMWAVMKKMHSNSSRVNKIMDKLIEDAEKDEKTEDEAKSFTEQFVECCKNLANAATK